MFQMFEEGKKPTGSPESGKNKIRDMQLEKETFEEDKIKLIEKNERRYEVIANAQLEKE